MTNPIYVAVLVLYIPEHKTLAVANVAEVFCSVWIVVLWCNTAALPPGFWIPFPRHGGWLAGTAAGVARKTEEIAGAPDDARKYQGKTPFCS